MIMNLKNNHFACVCPGQGSQEVGMLRDVADAFPGVKNCFSTASSVLGYDVWQIVQEGPADRLDNTIYTQPAMLTADISLWLAMQSVRSMKPALIAGHSLGEYAALVAAKALTFEDAIFLVDKRARLMQEAVPAGEGSTAVILGLASDSIQDICQEVSRQEGCVEAVNFNSPAQTVIAGKKTAVARVLELSKQKGAKKVLLLPLSIPVHCELMKVIVPRFSEYLNSVPIKTPEIPVIHNVDVLTHSHPDDIRLALAKQIHSPVRWIEIIERMKAEGIHSVIECGPKAVLAGLIKRIDSDLHPISINSTENIMAWAESLP